MNNYKNKYKGRSAIITFLLSFSFIFLLNLFGLEYKEPPLSYGFEVKFSQFANENFESKKLENEKLNSKIEDLKENNMISSVTEKKNELKKVETQKEPSDISLEKKDSDKKKQISDITRKVVSSFLKQGESKISDSTKKFDSNDATGASEGLFARYHRFSTPRSYDSKRETFRLVQGLRGSFNSWDWDSGLVISRATSEMDNHGRVDLTKMDAALADTTPNALNPFCAGILPCNEEQVMTSIYRDNTTELMMVDFKMSNPSVYSLPAGDIGMLVGAEVRYESHDDARDPNIDGTVYYQPPYPALNRPEPPYISNIANSSPSPDTFGERTVTSMFVELQVPLHETLDSQIAIRAEDADDFGSNVVGKVALGYVPNSVIKLRASTSTTFRAPNLITLNEGLVVRNNSQEDPLLTYAMQAYYASVGSSGTAPQDEDGN